MKMMTFSGNVLRTLIGAISALVLFPLASSTPLADNVSGKGSPYIEQADLADVIKTRNVDEILGALNKVKQMHYQGQILPYLLDLWNLRQDKYPELPWDVVSLFLLILFDSMSAMCLHKQAEMVLSKSIQTQYMTSPPV